MNVHARSVVAAAIDGVTGEVFRARLVPTPKVVIEWVRSLPGRAAVTYESGPAGFGLARDLTGEVFRARLVPTPKVVIEWVRSSPGRAAVTYESGPAGFRLARDLTVAGLRY